MMNQKGQELSLTTIILTILGLIVLIILAMVFTGRMASFGAGLTTIEETTQCTQACTSAEKGYKSGSVIASDKLCIIATHEEVQVPTLTSKKKCCCKKPA